MYLRGKSSTKGSLLSRRGRGARPSPSTRRNRATNPRDTSLLSSRLQFELAGLSARPIHSLDPFHFLRKQSFRFLTESPLITLIRYPFRDELWRTEEQFDLPYFFRKKEEEEETENEKEKGKEKRNDYRCLLHKSEDDEARESRDKINNVTAIDTRVRK